MKAGEDCRRRVEKLLSRMVGRISYDELGKVLSKGLDQNPVFNYIRSQGAFDKNIIIILGGRGCGKTLLMKYVQHYHSPEWEFKYVPGDMLSGSGLQKFNSLIDNVKKELEDAGEKKIILALDDIAEASEAAMGYIKDEIMPLLLEHAGRLKLVIAAQSERTTREGQAIVSRIFSDILASAPKATMFFGESPERSLTEAFKKSYVEMTPVKPFRGATLVNLDAYWSRIRSLSKLDELGKTIVGIFEFYIINAGGDCSELLEYVKSYTHGLAMLALASLPKVADIHEGVIIEYYNPEASRDRFVNALSGSGIADLLLKFLRDRRVVELAADLEKVYSSYLVKKKENIDVSDLKRAILNGVDALSAELKAEAIRSSSIQALGITPPAETYAKSGSRRRKSGPRIDFILLRRTIGQRESVIIVVLHDLKLDTRGYISSSSRRKFRTLIDLNVPSEAEGRYLAVLLPSMVNALRYVYEDVRNLSRVGRDVVPLQTSRLDNMDTIVVNLVARGPKEALGELDLKDVDGVVNVLYRIMIGSVLFKLRTPEGEPWLLYYILPTVV